MKSKNNKRTKSSSPGKQTGSTSVSVNVLMRDAMAHLQSGRFPEAEALYVQVLDVQPNHPDALHLLGLIAHHGGRYERAVELIDKALEVNPRNAEALSNRANILQELKRFQSALESSDKAILLNPNLAVAYNNRGNALQGLNQYQAALESYDKAILLSPDYAEAYSNRGNALLELKQYQAALESYDKVIRLNANHAKAYNNRGNALLELSQYQAALESYDRAILLNPQYVLAYNNRGNALQGLKQYHAALESYDEAIRLKPDLAEGYANRGNTRLETKQYQAALENYEKATLLRPNYEYLQGRSLFAKRNLCAWDDHDEECKRLEIRIGKGERATQPFDILAIIGSPSLQRRAAETYARDKYPMRMSSGEIPRRPRREKIRIGYFSADYRDHATCYLIAELFELHDRSKFELFGFSFGPDVNDGMRRRVAAAMDQFIDVRTLPDWEVAQLCRGLEIDIAVDLKGFTQGNRAGIFAERAAPIQVNYLGYPGTTGAPSMDYLIGDRTVIPEKCEQHYSEKVVCLPDSYQVNDSKRLISPNPYTRADEGLPETGFVYCCFNNDYKITPGVFDIWMRILGRVEGSVLWLLEDNVGAGMNLRKEAVRRGISPGRLIFAERKPLSEHLARHRLADLFLDTLPCNAHTTASDALWAGLPVLTCMGESFASRVAASLLNAIHLPELIVSTEEEYEALAVELALRPKRYCEIKERLKHNRLTTPLFDGEGVTRNLEAAYTAMYAKYQADASPDHIQIERER